MRAIKFSPEAFEEYLELKRNEPRSAGKVLDLLEDILKHPFQGLGKPEALKHDLKGFWSRRISEQHRLVYSVTDEEILVARCKSHYRT